MSKKLLLNSLSGTMLYAVNVVVAFIMSPVIIRALGNRDYGLWELVMSVIGYMGLLDLGIGTALVRFVSVADGRQDRDDLQQTISTSFAFFVVAGAIAAFLLLVLGYSPGLIAGSEIENIASLGTIFILLGINAGLLFPQQVFIATLMGVQRHYFINFTRIVLSIVRAGLTYYLLFRYQGRGLIVLALLEPIFTAMQFVAFAGAVHLDRNIPRFAWSAVSRQKAGEMITFAAKSATMLVASRLQSLSIPLIIGNMIGLGSIVYFVIPNRLVEYAKGLSIAIGFPITPYFGAAIGRGEQVELLKSWLDTTLALQIISLSMPIVILFCGESFLAIWIGKEYAVAGRWVLYFLAVGMAADALATNCFRMLTAQGSHGRCAMIWLCLSIASIPAGIWGAQQWGVPGVAATTTIVTVTANLITIFMTCRVMQVPVVIYLKETLLRLLTPLLLLAAVFYILTSYVNTDSYLKIFALVSSSWLVYCMAIWNITIDKCLRRIFYDKFIVAFQTKLVQLRLLVF